MLFLSICACFLIMWCACDEFNLIHNYTVISNGYTHLRWFLAIAELLYFPHAFLPFLMLPSFPSPLLSFYPPSPYLLPYRLPPYWFLLHMHFPVYHTSPHPLLFLPYIWRRSVRAGHVRHCLEGREVPNGKGVECKWCKCLYPSMFHINCILNMGREC